MAYIFYNNFFTMSTCFSKFFCGFPEAFVALPPAYSHSQLASSPAKLYRRCRSSPPLGRGHEKAPPKEELSPQVTEVGMLPNYCAWQGLPA